MAEKKNYKRFFKELVKERRKRIHKVIFRIIRAAGKTTHVIDNIILALITLHITFIMDTVSHTQYILNTLLVKLYIYTG